MKIPKLFRETSFQLEPVKVYFSCAVEQWLARQAHNLEVVGSNPAGAIFEDTQPGR